jgi:hypothetical protein
LKTRKEEDLLLFLMECDDKSPAFDQKEFDGDEIQETIINSRCYLPGKPFVTGLDTLCMAHQLEPEAILLSLPTAKEWSDIDVNVLVTRGEQIREESFSLRNISLEKHGDHWREILEKSLEQSLSDLCPVCIFSGPFEKWYNALGADNKHRVQEKLKLAHNRSFQGGEPLFKSIESSPGLWEIRFDAYQGGAIRVLYKGCEDKQAILAGFIKKSNKGGYTVHISIAEREWDNLCTS